MLRPREAVRELELHIDSLDVEESVSSRLREAVQVLAPKRRRPAKKLAPGRSREERKASKAEARRATRPLVEARACGLCEVAALGGCGGALTWDHFFGRGKVPPSVELEWMLCWNHHQQKDHGGETGRRLKWLRIFRMHAEFYGYQDAIARCDRAIAGE